MREPLPSTRQKSAVQAATVGDGVYASAARGPMAEEGGSEFSQALSVLRRRKWLIALVAGIGTLASASVLMSLFPRYTAVATLVLDTRPTRALDVTAATVNQLLGGPQADVGVVQTELTVLRSPRLAEIVIRKLELLDNPKAEFSNRRGEFGAWFEGNVTPMLRALRQSIDLGQELEQPAGLRARGGPAGRVEQATETLIKNLRVTTEARSYVIRLAYESADPDLAADIVNSVAETYVALQLATRRDAVNRANAWLAERAAELRDQVRETEGAAEQFKERSGLSEVRGMTVKAQQLAELNSQIIIAASERSQKAAELQGIIEAARASNATRRAITSPLLQHLREQEAILLQRNTELTSRLGPSHPQLVALEAQRHDIARAIEREIDTRVEALTADVRSAAAREDALREHLAQLQAEDSGLTGKRVKLRQLEREAEANRTTFASLLSRWKQTEGEGDRQQPDARIIAGARIPDAPSFPKTSSLLALSCGAFALLGLVLAFVVELADRTFRTVRDLERITSRRCAGFTPAFARLAATDELMLRRDTSLYADAIRSIRLTVSRSTHPRPAPKVVLVTSAVPSEGKSVFALSLARSAAQAEYRTLLIDCDLRRPSINRLLRQTAGVDFTSLCTSAERSPVITPGELVQNDTESSLHFIPSSGHSRSPQDLLNSAGTREFLNRMRAEYDLIVLDTPPLLAATDALVLAPLADTTVFLVRWGSTPRAVVVHALQMLVREGVAIAGSVLSRVEMRKYRAWGEKEHGHLFAQYRNDAAKQPA